jgi:ZIP family zinc transporter
VIEFLEQFNPIQQTLFGTGFTWFMTALGASIVFFAKDLPQKLLDGMLGFAAGVMIAASYWSLLAPAIEMSEGGSVPVWVPAVVGFIVGGVFLRLVDFILPHLHPGDPIEMAEGVKTKWQKSTLLVLAITLHNIPEGLAIGVAFGAVAVDLGTYTLPAAIALAIGIGIQNFPEGTIVSLPLRREGMSRRKAFWYGQLSAVPEPIAGVIGAAIVLTSQAILPYALAFAAGAMIFVVAEEVIPEAHANGHRDIATGGVMVGFAVMMTLDVALG